MINTLPNAGCLLRIGKKISDFPLSKCRDERSEFYGSKEGNGEI